MQEMPSSLNRSEPCGQIKVSASFDDSGLVSRDGLVLPDAQDERGGVTTYDEHAEPDIPGSRVVGGAHGGGGMLVVTAVRGVDAAGCSL
jgi:hypothetical protein